MKQASQYEIDVKRLSELISKFTGVSKLRAADFFAECGVSQLFQSSYSLFKSNEQHQKLELLYEFMRLYVSLCIDEKKYILNTTENAREYFTNFYLDKQDKEYFSIAFQDAQCKIIRTKILSAGSIQEAPIYPREVIKEALFANAVCVTISHNHPACSLNPTDADMTATEELVKNLNAVEIIVNDHILVAGHKAVSFAESGIDLGSKNHHYTVKKNDTPKKEPAQRKKSVRTAYCR